MKVVSALLCDAASVRQGLLFVLGGGITRLWRTEYPAELGASLAMMLEMHQMELSRPHEIDVLVQGEDGAELARAKGGFQLDGGDFEVGEPALVPFVLDLHRVGLPSLGTYTVEIAVDGQHQHSLRVSARPPEEQSPS